MYSELNNFQLDDEIERLLKSKDIASLAAACTERERRREYQIKLF